MNIEYKMMQNIFFISIIILLFFFISSEEKINDITTKKYMKFLFLLIIIYFVYQNYNFAILLILFGIFIFFNLDLNKIKTKFSKNQEENIDENLENNKPFFTKFFNSELFKNYQSFKSTIYDYFKNREHFNFEPYQEKKDVKEQKNNSSNEPSGKLESLISSPSLSPILSLGTPAKTENTAPFKEDIKKIRDMYENIKMEINKIGK
jgi:predicted membrane protein